MKSFKEIFSCKEQKDNEVTQETKKEPVVRRNKLTHKEKTIICASLFVLSVSYIAFCIIDTVSIGAKAVSDSFAIATEEGVEEVYQYFYNQSYESSEKIHHVNNNVSISIGDLRELQVLEVLKIGDVSYEILNPQSQSWLEDLMDNGLGVFEGDVAAWLEIPGKGMFTINMQAGEIIIDEERHNVLIRIPYPELTEFDIDYGNVELLFFEESGGFKKSAKFGVEIAIELLQNAELTMMQNINNNQEFFKRARLSAEKMLVSIVQQLNPQIKDLKVTIEFIG